MGVAPELWVKAEIVRGETVGVYLLPEPDNDSSSCQRLCVERDCGIKTLGELFVSQSDHGIDTHGATAGKISSQTGDSYQHERHCNKRDRISRADAIKERTEQAGQTHCGYGAD